MTRKRFFRIFIITGFAAAALWLTKPMRMPDSAAAQSPAVSLSPSDAALARDIENNLIAPCCWVQPVSEHPSEVSDLIRAEVRSMVAEGKSRDEILDYYVAKYGERILAAPRAGGVNALAYAAPFAALILGGLGLLLRGKRRARVSAADPLPVAQMNSPYNDIIDKELRELDD